MIDSYAVKVVPDSRKPIRLLQSLLHRSPRHIHIRIGLLMRRHALVHVIDGKHVRYIFPHGGIRHFRGADDAVCDLICALSDIACFAHDLEPSDEFVERFDGRGVEFVKVLVERNASEEDA
jgi:hypothetical protein